MHGTASVVAALPPADGARPTASAGRSAASTSTPCSCARRRLAGVDRCSSRARCRRSRARPGRFRLRLRSTGEGGAETASSRPRSSSPRTARGSRCPRSARPPRAAPAERPVRLQGQLPPQRDRRPTCCRCCRSPAATAAWSSPTTASPRSPAASARTGSAAIAKRIPASAPATCSRRSCGANAPASPRRSPGAERDGPWLATGPIRPGVRLGQGDGVFRIGNAAGEAHPIVGEGISMAMQSAFVLAAVLGPAAAAPGRSRDSRRRGPGARAARVRGAAGGSASRRACASPPPSRTWRCGRGRRRCAWPLVRAWPGLLTHGARWSGKTRCVPEAAQLVAQGGGAGPPLAAFGG